MKISELRQDIFRPLCLPDPDRDIRGVYMGDLLSWVMGRAEEDNAWITIMSNRNVIAVASLISVSCVILTEDVTLDADVLALAEQKEINIFTTALSSYDACIALYRMLNE
ncbi:MAG: hypothetical protein J6Z23_02770 [Lachnospiraceae bacterium]|nr:hypothetical protein [Lachnospiraceae bacterium]